MKYLALTLCLATSALALSACETTSTSYSGASYAGGRTAGEMGGAPVTKYKKPSKTETVFKSHMSK